MTVIPEEGVTWDAESNLQDYLRFLGWSPLSEGPAGTMWSNPALDAELGVPRGVQHGTGLWDGMVDRLSYWHQLEKLSVDTSIRRFWMDVSDFRATSSIVRGDYIAAEAGSALFSSAWKILRSSATTARGSKSAIEGKYSSAGDRSIDGAMFAQTERGSYVLPLLVPLSRSLSEAGTPGRKHAQQPSLGPEDYFASREEETEQRRVTRTMAQALTAVYKNIVEPAVEPTASAVNGAIVAGASRELVRALYDIVHEPTVKQLEVSFSWAPRAGQVTSAAPSVSIPREADILLERAARKMTVERSLDTVTRSGPIIALYHPKGLNMGEATIEAGHKGRLRRIIVRLEGEKVLANAHRWFQAHETIVVRGQVRSTSDGLRIDSPGPIQALGQTILFQDD